MALTQQQFAERLRAKIASQAEFDALLVEAYSENSTYIPRKDAKPGSSYYLYRLSSIRPSPTRTLQPVIDPVAGGATGIPSSRWWAARELLRYAHGVYLDADQPLSMIAGFVSHTFVHPSANDPSMVAYTPDPESGEKDKQLATTLSKFCRRYFPVLTDDRIRDIEAAYRASMSTEVEFITGAKDIINAYRNGPGACMSKGAASYEAGGHHPVEAYDAPGIAMAVSRDKDGTINGRTMTYVNPEDPADKRWIRLYGDTALIRRLERQGFRCGNWQGVKFKRILVKGTTNKFVMPYLDANGSACSTDYCSVVLTKDWVRCLTAKEITKSALTQRRQVPGTSGYVTLSVDCSGYFEFKCAIDGKEYKADTAVAYILQDGAAQRVNPANITKAWVGPYKVAIGADLQDCYVKDQNVFSEGDITYVDDNPTREAVGYVALDAARYAALPSLWVKKAVAVKPSGRETWFLSEDCFQAIDLDSNGRAVPVMQVRESSADTDSLIASGEYYEAHRVGSARTLAKANVPFKLTKGGSKVIRGVHKDLRILPDDGLEFARNVELRNVLEVRWWARTADTAPLDIESIPVTNLLDRVFNDYAIYYTTQIPATRREDCGGSWGPGTWNNFMCCWLQHVREYDTTIPVVAASGTHIIAGAWPSLPNYTSSSRDLMRSQYIAQAAVYEKICAGTMPFADSVSNEQQRRFIEQARITRVIRERAARALGAFPHALDGTSTPEVVAAAPAPAPADLARFLVAE